MKIHFIAIGGALMHNLAIALKRKGYEISGSDDEIYDPSKSRLNAEALLPEQMGWAISRIHKDLDLVILGMHARKDNPELHQAKALGIRVCSYPEFLYEQSREKLRIVVGGSHGKTTTTSMIMHILAQNNLDFDYAVGAQLDGFDCMVQLSDAPIIVIEGDEYLSSPIDRRAKFLHYNPHIALITGVAWDHINVFPTFDVYKEQFERFIDTISPNGHLIYYKQDSVLQDYAPKCTGTIIGYDTPPYTTTEGKTTLIPSGQLDKRPVPLRIFGAHNLQNMEAARQCCRILGIGDRAILNAMSSFGGASKRLEIIAQKEGRVLYKDFAHAPSKVKATVKAMQEQFSTRPLLALLELHTFSSLNRNFMTEYAGSMEKAAEVFVYFSPDTLKRKKMPAIAPEEVASIFAHPNIRIFTDATLLQAALVEQITTSSSNILMMSSGHWGGISWSLLKNKFELNAKN